jgi:hypothetical protein
MCAKKGRVARILTTLHRVAGTPISTALQRRANSAKQRGDAGTHNGEKSQWRKRKEREARKAQFQDAAMVTGLPQGYHSGMSILLVGEGNLSFALSLVTLFDGEGANVLATTLDKHGVARAAYPDCRDIEESLEATGAAVRFGVDAEDPNALRKVAKEWWAAVGLHKLEASRPIACKRLVPTNHWTYHVRTWFQSLLANPTCTATPRGMCPRSAKGVVVLAAAAAASAAAGAPAAAAAAAPGPGGSSAASTASCGTSPTAAWAPSVGRGLTIVTHFIA